MKLLNLRPVHLVFGLLFVIATFFIARQNYLLFHAIADGFTVLVGAFIFDLANTTYSQTKNKYYLILGNTMFFTSMLDLLHILTYQNATFLSVPGANIPTQLWIAGRFIFALSLLTAPWMTRLPLTRFRTFIIYFIITALLTASILWIPVFPDCYTPDNHLTPFKVWSEFFFCLILLAAITFGRRILPAISSNNMVFVYHTTLIISILSELSITMYSDVNGTYNYWGHLLKLIAYYLIYRGVVRRSHKEIMKHY